MGAVYKARDPRLKRDVAIKIVPPEAAADGGRRARFEQEAQAASALNHPNIATIYEIATDDGTTFIAMEYVPGRTLAETIPRRGLNVSVALRYGAQILFYRFDDQKTQTVYRLPRRVALGLSVAPDESWFLFSQLDGSGADLMLIDAFSAGR